MSDIKDINKLNPDQQQANAGAQAQAAPQAAPAAQPAQAGQAQDLQLGALVEEVRTYLQKTVDALNTVSTAMQSAQDTNRGLNETMSKMVEEFTSLKKTIGNIEAENKKQEAERQDAPKEPHVDPGAGETTEHKETTPSDAELKEKVPGKQLLGQKGEETEKSAKKDIVKVGGETPVPQSGVKEVDTDITKSLIPDILSGKLKGAGNVIGRIQGSKN